MEEEKQPKTEEETETVETAEISEETTVETTEEVLEEEEIKKETIEPETEEAEALQPLKEEESKLPPREEKPEEEDIVEERFYTVPLGKAWIMPPNKRAARAMRILRGFIVRHMKLEKREEEAEEEEEVKRLIVSNEVNERVWSRGIKKPPRKIRVRAARDKDGNVTVYLAEGD